MKRNIIIMILLIISIFLTVSCSNNTVSKDALKFKEDYESLNGKTNALGKEHRNLSINQNNPFIYTNAEDIVEKIINGETFYVYFGSTLCPWCRSVIEKAIEVANLYNVDKIYYVDIWDEEGDEILRDKYIINEEDTLEKVVEGTDAYYELLRLFDSVLSDYNLTNSEGNTIKTNEKRIYAPNFIYVKNGEAIKLTDGISSLQEDSREFLSQEVLSEEELMFKEFFNN